jgi:hypothetical protein
MNSCEGGALKELLTLGEEACTGYSSEGGELVWQSPESNFDDFPNALLLLLQMGDVGSYARFSESLKSLTSITEPGLPPKLNYSPQNGIFVLSFGFLSLFMNAMFVGVIISQFSRSKLKISGFDRVSKGQRNWLQIQKWLLASRPMSNPSMPDMKTAWGRFRNAVFHAISFKWQDLSAPKGDGMSDSELQHASQDSAALERDGIPLFELAVQLCIVCNAFLLASIYYGMSSSYANAVEVCNQIFTWLFVLEFMLKVIAWGVRQYFVDSWNQFDFAVTFLSLLGEIFTTISIDLNFNFTIIRGMRVFRLLRLVRISKGVAVLMQVTRPFPPFSLPSSLLCRRHHRRRCHHRHHHRRHHSNAGGI